MSGLEDRKVEVLQVDNPTANTSEALFPKCESEVSRSDIETAVTADSHSEPLIYTHESFDNIRPLAKVAKGFTITHTFITG